MKIPIYLDYAATTPVDPRVAQEMARYLTMDGIFGNSASTTHSYGFAAAKAVEAARAQVAKLIGAQPEEIIWTSGATESNNLALKGAAHFYRTKGQHIITSQIEHKTVLDTCSALEKQGFRVTYLHPEKNGLITVGALEEAIQKDTILVSLMHVNNELGVIQDLKMLSQCCRNHDILFHSDVAQSLGKTPIDVTTMPVDLLALSAHKIYGPKGIGALYIRKNPRVRLEPLIHGGGQERSLRSGTLAQHQIVGFGCACQIMSAESESDQKHITELRDTLWQGIQAIGGIYLNGDFTAQIPNIFNISIDNVEGESLVVALKDIAISTGSACTSASIEPSHVLRGIGIRPELAHSSLRISLGRFTTEEEISYAIQHIKAQVERLRELRPHF